jgi:hypothetical protein
LAQSCAAKIRERVALPTGVGGSGDRDWVKIAAALFGRRFQVVRLPECVLRKIDVEANIMRKMKFYSFMLVAAAGMLRLGLECLPEPDITFDFLANVNPLG